MTKRKSKAGKKFGWGKCIPEEEEEEEELSWLFFLAIAWTVKERWGADKERHLLETLMSKSPSFPIFEEMGLSGIEFPFTNKAPAAGFTVFAFFRWTAHRSISIFSCVFFYLYFAAPEEKQFPLARKRKWFDDERKSGTDIW